MVKDSTMILVAGMIIIGGIAITLGIGYLSYLASLNNQQTGYSHARMTPEQYFGGTS